MEFICHSRDTSCSKQQFPRQLLIPKYGRSRMPSPGSPNSSPLLRIAASSSHFARGAATAAQA